MHKLSHVFLAGLTRFCDQALGEGSRVFEAIRTRKADALHLSYQDACMKMFRDVTPEGMDLIDFSILASEEGLQLFLACCVQDICKTGGRAVEVDALKCKHGVMSRRSCLTEIASRIIR